VACVPIADPVDLSSAVVPPAPDPTKTTRERFAVHAADPQCAACHNLIDNFGFAFEHLDGMGRLRALDNEKPVDASVVVTGTDFDGSYADSNELVQALAQSAQVRECFARHAFRALAGRSSEDVRPSEDHFVSYFAQTPDAVDANIVSTLGAYIVSPSFPYRRAR
jgi:hypothetical protein